MMTTEEGWLCIGVDVTEKQRSLELERHRLERNRQNEIMQDILSGRLAEKNAAEPLLALGLDLRKPLLCLAVRRVPPDCPDEYSSLRQETDLLLDRCRIVSGGIAWEAADCIGILVSDDAELLPQTGRTEFQQAEEIRQNGLRGRDVFLHAGLIAHRGFFRRFQNSVYSCMLVALE